MDEGAEIALAKAVAIHRNGDTQKARNVMNNSSNNTLFLLQPIIF